jgi:hypothetical protein
VLVASGEYLLNCDAMIGNGLRCVRTLLVANAEPEPASFSNPLDSAFGNAGLDGVACEKEREL